jgi:cysteinyl-tRNA synthetase
MITINGQKMGKSLGNFITLPELFSGSHPKLERAYSPMTVRFFILQAHYRSTLDFSNEALQAAEKGYRRLMAAARALGAGEALAAGQASDRAFARIGSRSDVRADACPAAASPAVSGIAEAVWEALCDDMNTPVAIANLFEAVRMVNGGNLPEGDKAALRNLFDEVVFGVLGLRDEEAAGSSGKAEKALEGVMDIVLEDRRKARAEKNWAESDRIRDLLASFGITVKDTKDGATWTLE